MRSVNGARLVGGARLAVPDWLSDVVPDWLAEVMRPKKVAPPWGAMARAVLALWVPMAVGFAAGQRELGLLPAMGGLLSVQIDNGGPYWPRVQRIGTAAVLGGAPGLLIGTLIHGRGWVAVGAVMLIAGVSSVLARLGGTGSVTGLQLFVYSALGLGPMGALRPWWHTALGFLVGAAWALLLITPGYLLSPRSAERKAVAEVYYTLARGLRLTGTPGMTGARTALAGALNAAYDAMLTGRASDNGRSTRDMHLMAVLNVSHQFAEAAAALRATGEPVPPLVTEDIERFGDAILDERGPASGVLGFGGRGGSGGPRLPLIPPPWSASPGALALREAMVSLERVLSGNWVTATPPSSPPSSSQAPGLRPGLMSRARARTLRVAEQLLGGRIAWEFTVRLMVCTGVAAVISEVLPLQRSYWVVLTVGIILKPDYGSVFARALQRGIGTVVGAAGGAVILAAVPYGPWLLLPFGVLAALQPYGKARSFGLSAVFLTPLVVLLIDLLQVGGWHLAEARLVDTVLASAVVLLVGYAPWPSAWQAHLPGQFAGTLRAVCAYLDEALAATPAARIAATGSARSPARAPGEAPGVRSRLRRRAYRSLSDLRAEFQRTMSEPAPVSWRAAAWWPAVVSLEEVMDAATATVVAIGQGGAVPPARSVHALTGTLRAVADAIETLTPPRLAGPLPADPELEAVTSAVHQVLSVLTRSAQPARLSPASGGTAALAHVDRGAQRPPFRLGRAPPDAVVLVVRDRPVQAGAPHRAGLTDPLGLRELASRRPARPGRKEQLGVEVTARRGMPPVELPPGRLEAPGHRTTMVCHEFILWLKAVRRIREVPGLPPALTRENPDGTIREAGGADVAEQGPAVPRVVGESWRKATGGKYRPSLNLRPIGGLHDCEYYFPAKTSQRRDNSPAPDPRRNKAYFKRTRTGRVGIPSPRTKGQPTLVPI